MPERSPSDAHSLLMRVGGILVLAVVYATAGKLGLSLATVHPSATAVWPPTGIALAALLLLGLGLWPGVFLGAFVVNLTTEGTVATSLGIATGNTLEAVVGVLLVRRYAGGVAAFERSRTTMAYAALAGLVAPAIAATVGVSSLALAGFAAWRDFGSIWLTWWLGDMGGALVVAPVLILWWLRPLPGWDGRRIVEVGLLALALVAVGLTIFSGIFEASRENLPLTFLALPLMAWAAFRLGHREAATVTLALSSLATWGTLHGFGPFARFPPNASLVLVQAFMVTLAVTGLLIASAVQERRRVTLELRRSHEELEQFAYVASHDLREPLRAVAGYLQLLSDVAKDRLEGDDQQLLHGAADAAIRMDALLDGLLAWARLGGPPQPFQAVSMQTALDQSLANLSVAVKESGAVVTREALPVVRGDPARLAQLFQNLVGNAIKFRRGSAPLIHVSASADGRWWRFAVRDDGIGLDPRHAEEIFEVFRRLDPAGPSGVGVGLAVARRIVGQHGGRIWVESVPGAGSTFFFTLPRDR